jgi:hypothetical protein
LKTTSSTEFSLHSLMAGDCVQLSLYNSFFVGVNHTFWHFALKSQVMYWLFLIRYEYHQVSLQLMCLFGVVAVFSPFYLFSLITDSMGAHGSKVGWGTVLQAKRSRVPFPMR